MSQLKSKPWSILLGVVVVVAFVALCTSVLVGPSQTEAMPVADAADQAGDIDSASPLAALTAGEVVGRRGRRMGNKLPGSPSQP